MAAAAEAALQSAFDGLSVAVKDEIASTVASHFGSAACQAPPTGHLHRYNTALSTPATTKHSDLQPVNGLAAVGSHASAWGTLPYAELLAASHKAMRTPAAASPATACGCFTTVDLAAHGLYCNGYDKLLFKVKYRSKEVPLIAHVALKSQADGSVADFEQRVQALLTTHVCPSGTATAAVGAGDASTGAPTGGGIA